MATEEEATPAARGAAQPPPPAEPPPAASAGPPPLAAPPPHVPPVAAPRPVIAPSAANSAKPVILAALGIALIAAIALTLYLTGVFGGRNGDSAAFADQAPTASSTDRSASASPLPPAAASASAAAPAPCQGVVPAAEFDNSVRHDGVSNRLIVGPGSSVTWNGVVIDPSQLRQYLDITATLRPTPMLVTRLDPAADPAMVETVRDVIGRALGCSRPRL